MKKVLFPHSVEIEKIKGSRFVGDIFPVLSIEEALSFIADLKAKRRDSSHICYAIRMEPEVFRFSDDGEPRNSAGAPILKRLQSLDIISCLCTVTRYYGGVKLGVGGLIRAYGSAAKAVLNTCELEETVMKLSFSFDYNYSDTALVTSVLSSYPEIEFNHQYLGRVLTSVVMPIHLKQSFLKALLERTSGRIQLINPL